MKWVKPKGSKIDKDSILKWFIIDISPSHFLVRDSMETPLRAQTTEVDYLCTKLQPNCKNIIYNGSMNK